MVTGRRRCKIRPTDFFFFCPKRSGVFLLDAALHNFVLIEVPRDVCSLLYTAFGVSRWNALARLQ